MLAMTASLSKTGAAVGAGADVGALVAFGSIICVETTPPEQELHNTGHI